MKANTTKQIRSFATAPQRLLQRERSCTFQARSHLALVVQTAHLVPPAQLVAAGAAALGLMVHQEVVVVLLEQAPMGPVVRTLEDRIRILSLHLICGHPRVEQMQVVR